MSMQAQRGRSPMICRYEMPQGILSGKSQAVPVTPPVTPLSLTLQNRQPSHSPLSSRKPNLSPPPRTSLSMVSSPSTPMAPPPIVASGYSSSRFITRQVSEVRYQQPEAQEGSHVAAPIFGHGQTTPTLSPSPMPRAKPWVNRAAASPTSSPSPLFGTAQKLVPSGSPPISRRGRAAMPGTVQQTGSYSLSASSSSPALPIFSGGGGSARATVAATVSVPATAPTSFKGHMTRNAVIDQSPVLGGSSASYAVSALSPSPSPVRSATIISTAAPKTVYPPQAATTAATSKQTVFHDSMRIDDRRRTDSPLVDGVASGSNVSWARQAPSEPASPLVGSLKQHEAAATMPMAYLPTSQHRPPPTAQRMPARLNRSGSLSSLTASRRGAKAPRTVAKTTPTVQPKEVQAIMRRASASPPVRFSGAAAASVQASSVASVSPAVGNSRAAGSIADSRKSPAAGGLKPPSLDSSMSASCGKLEGTPIQVGQVVSPPAPAADAQPPSLNGSVRMPTQASVVAATQMAPGLAVVDNGRGRIQGSPVALSPDLRPRSSGDLAPRRSSALPSPELKARRAGVYSTPEVRHRRTSSSNCGPEAEAKSELDELSPLPSCVVRPTTVKEKEDQLPEASEQGASVATIDADKPTAEEPGLGDTASSSRTCEPLPEVSRVCEPVPEAVGDKAGETQTAVRPLSAQQSPPTTAAISSPATGTIASAAPVVSKEPTPEKVDPLGWSAVPTATIIPQPTVSPVTSVPMVVSVKSSAATAQNGESKPEASPALASPVVATAVAAPALVTVVQAPAGVAAEPAVSTSVAAPAVSTAYATVTGVIAPAGAATATTAGVTATSVAGDGDAKRGLLLHDVKLDLAGVKTLKGETTLVTVEQPDIDANLVSQRTELLPEEGDGEKANLDSPERQCAWITEDILSRYSVGKMDESGGLIVPTEIFRNLSEELQLQIGKQKLRSPQQRRSERASRVLTVP